MVWTSLPHLMRVWNCETAGCWQNVGIRPRLLLIQWRPHPRIQIPLLAKLGNKCTSFPWGAHTLVCDTCIRMKRAQYSSSRIMNDCNVTIEMSWIYPGLNATRLKASTSTLYLFRSSVVCVAVLRSGVFLFLALHSNRSVAFHLLERCLRSSSSALALCEI